MQIKRPLALTGTAFAGVSVLLASTPTITVNAATTPSSDLMPMSATVALLSHNHNNGIGYAYGHSGEGFRDHDDDHDDDDDDDDGRWGRGGGIGGFIENFLADNQDQVLAFTAMIPTFYLGPVAVGNSLLANAYYNGYEGSPAGGEGVVAYVVSQLGAPPGDIVQSLVLGATSLIPQFNIGPVAVGNSILANAFFSGYEGSATGLPGVISYVTSQLGLQTPPPAAALAAAKTAPAAPVAAATVEQVASDAAAPAPAALPASADATEDAHDPVPGKRPATAAAAGVDAPAAVAVRARAGVLPGSGDASAAADAAADKAKSVSRGAVSAKADEGVRSVKARQGRSAAAASTDDT